MLWKKINQGRRNPRYRRQSAQSKIGWSGYVSLRREHLNGDLREVRELATLSIAASAKPWARWGRLCGEETWGLGRSGFLLWSARFQVYQTGGDIRLGYTSLEFRSENWARNRNMHVVGVEMAFNTPRLCESSEQVKTKCKTAPWGGPAFPDPGKRGEPWRRWKR